MSRGRPGAPQSIVNPNELLSQEDILQEDWCLLELGNHLREPITVLHWLAQRRLIRNSLHCDQCAQPFGLNAYQDATDGYRWYCKSCKLRRSVRDDSFFAHSRLPLKQLICYAYCWSRNMAQNDILHEARMNNASKTLAAWGVHCRDICEMGIEENPSMINNINKDGTPVFSAFICCVVHHYRL